jgi:Tat protein secretion system quality control protein TatD with DNase activity
MPYRGQRCEPAYVKAVALTLADVHGLTLDAVDLITTQAAENLFFAL